jgi:hypothetical protein
MYFFMNEKCLPQIANITKQWVSHKRGKAYQGTE